MKATTIIEIAKIGQEIINPVGTIRMLNTLKTIKNKSNQRAVNRATTALKRRLKLQIASYTTLLLFTATTAMAGNPLTELKENYKDMAIATLEAEGKTTSNYYLEVWPNYTAGTAIVNATGNDLEQRNIIKMRCKKWQTRCVIEDQELTPFIDRYAMVEPMNNEITTCSNCGTDQSSQPKGEGK